MTASSTTLQLLDAWKSEKKLPSDNQAAIALGIGRTTISKWRNDGSHASPPLAARMARDLGRSDIEVLQALAAIESERAIDAETKRTWSRLAGKALSAALVSLAALSLPQSADAGQGAFQTAQNAGNNVGLYIMRSARRRRWGLRRSFRFVDRRWPALPG